VKSSEDEAEIIDNTGSSSRGFRSTLPEARDRISAVEGIAGCRARSSGMVPGPRAARFAVWVVRTGRDPNTTTS
jgi:hypothetical protein